MPTFFLADHNKGALGLVHIVLFTLSVWFALASPLPLGGVLLLPIAVALGVMGQRRLALAILLATIACCLAGWHWLAWQVPPNCFDIEASLEGRVMSFPRYLTGVDDPRVYRLTVAVDQVAGHVCGQPSKVVAYIPRTLGVLSLGEKVRLYGRLRPPPSQWNPGSVPDQASWLARGQHARMSVTSASVVDSQPGLLAATRRGLAADIDGLSLAEGPRGLLHALVLGNGAALSDSHWQRFRQLGISHVAVISGLHLGLVFLLVWQLSYRILLLLSPSIMLCRDWSLLPALLAAAGYAGLAGFSLPTLRALLMLTGMVALGLMRRKTGSCRLLLLAAAVLVCANPFAVLGASFWLSVGATGALLWLSGYDRPSGARWSLLSWWRLLKLQVFLLVLVAPLTLFWFGELHPVAVVANLLIVPMVSMVLVPLALTGALWLLVPGTDGNPVWFAAGAVAEVVLQVTDHAAERLPATWTFAWHRPWPKQRGEIEVVTLDVGQGLAAVVRAPGLTLVYDTGDAVPSGFSQFGKVVVPYLRHRGLPDPDLWVISHGDRDHAGGLPMLHQQFPNARIMGFGGQPCRPGQWLWGANGVVVRVLNGPGDDNDGSCVIRLDYSGHSVLLAGDISASRERDLVRYWREQLRADVLVVAHHGSKTSTAASFLKWVEPSIALISAGANNRFGHPHPVVLQRFNRQGIEARRTDLAGAVSVFHEQEEWRTAGQRDGTIPYWLRKP